MRKTASKLNLAAALSALILSSGCTRLAEQNIISTINTGIGATLTENPQTQLYEVKLGYIRTQFYNVPTGKSVCGKQCKTSCTTACRNFDADKSPQVVSGIRMNSGIKHLFLGMDVSENFAVGETAVNSQAAVAMYISDARNTNSAEAAASAVKSVAVSDPSLLEMQKELDGLLKKSLQSPSPAGETTEQRAEKLARQITKQTRTLRGVRRAGGEDLQKLITQLKQAVQ